MENLTEYYKIAGLIAAELADTITEEEKILLEKWMQKEPSHPKIYHQITERLEKGEDIKSWWYEPSVKADWKKVKNKLSYQQSQNKIGRHLHYYAAIILLLIGIASTILYLKETPSLSQFSELCEETSIKAGSSKAILTLANGEKVILEETTTDSIKADGTLIEKKEGGLAYQSAENTTLEEQEVFNVLNIPNGGEYKLTLADGTKVWVNSASELKYPVKFMGHSRTVYIKGEAYFEVTQNLEKPFIVKTTNHMEIKVLGTHFNVSAYENDPTIATTLSEGKVLVSNGQNSVDLIPNQQAVFEKANAQLTCRNVDAYQYLSWKDGKFIFEGETLENIMERLSRWYDIQVFFRGSRVRTLRFSGDLEKYKDFSTAIRMLEKVSRIKVEIKNNTVFIEER